MNLQTFSMELINFFHPLRPRQTSYIAIYYQHVTRLGLMGFRSKKISFRFSFSVIYFIYGFAITNELIICYVILDVMKMEKWKIVQDHRMKFFYQLHMSRGFWCSLSPRTFAHRENISAKLSPNLALYGD